MVAIASYRYKNASDGVVTDLETIDGLRYTRNNNQSITEGVSTTIDFDTVQQNVSGSADPLSSGVLTIPTAGVWRFDFAAGGQDGELLVVDEKAQASNGGDFGANPVVRDLNTVRKNTIAGASLATNTITLPPGTYETEAYSTTYHTERSQISIRDTGNNILVQGMSDHTNRTYGGYSTMFAKGFFTINTTTNIQLIFNRTNNYSGDTEGGRGNTYGPEIFSLVHLKRVPGILTLYKTPVATLSPLTYDSPILMGTYDTSGGHQLVTCAKYDKIELKYNGYIIANSTDKKVFLSIEYRAGATTARAVGLIADDVTGVIETAGNLTVGNALNVNGNVGIGTNNSLSRLSITPSGLEPKITLWDAGLTTEHYGFGISPYQLNYHVGNADARHVFYSGGKNGDGTELMRIQGDGKVGIGTNAPVSASLLHVEGSGINYTWPASGHFFTTDHGVIAAGGGYTLNNSIYAAGGITSRIGFYATSDERIKMNSIEIIDSEALDILRKLKPRKYEYIDKMSKNTDTPVFGFYAQEVEELIPYAVGTTSEYIPNIYSQGTIENIDGEKCISINSIEGLSEKLNNYEGSNIKIYYRTYPEGLDIDNIKLEDYNSCNIKIEEYDISVKEIINNTTFSINENFDINGKIFIYGHYVSDFKSLKYNSIYTIATSAVQEIDRQLQTTKAELQTTKAELQTTKEELQVTKEELQTIKSFLQNKYPGEL